VSARPQLSDTDVKMLRLIAGGATNQVIARELEVSTATTGRWLTTLFAKMGATDRTHAAIIALEMAVIEATDVTLPTWVHRELSDASRPVPDGD
jgi:DNA-binding NarL/FixJ family response regulator